MQLTPLGMPTCTHCGTRSSYPVLYTVTSAYAVGLIVVCYVTHSHTEDAHMLSRTTAHEDDRCHEHCVR